MVELLQSEDINTEAIPSFNTIYNKTLVIDIPQNP